jgi:hypothetical protein
MNLDDLKAEWRVEMQRAGSAVDLRFEGLEGQVTGLRRGIRFGGFWIVFAFVGVSLIEVFEQFVALEGAGWMSKLGRGVGVLDPLAVCCASQICERQPLGRLDIALAPGDGD